MGSGGRDESFRSAVCDAHEHLLQQILTQPQVDVGAVAAEYGLGVDSRFATLDAPRVCTAVHSMAQRVRRGERLRLLCWCRPKRCHADNIAAAVLKLAGRLGSAAHVHQVSDAVLGPPPPGLQSTGSSTEGDLTVPPATNTTAPTSDRAENATTDDAACSSAAARAPAAAESGVISEPSTGKSRRAKGRQAGKPPRGAGIIATSSSGLVVICRKRDGKASFPKGGRDGQSVRDAAVREWVEETGLPPAPLEFTGGWVDEAFTVSALAKHRNALILREM